MNELAVANKLMTDPALASAVIAYEPDIAAGAKFDFVISEAEGPTIFVEVKTVSPQTRDDDANWREATYRRRRLARGAHFVVDRMRRER